MENEARALASLDITLVERLFDHLSSSPFFVKDDALRYVAANEAMLDLCGVRNRKALIGRTAQDFFPKVLAERYELLDRQVLTTKKPVRDRLDLTLRAGVRPVWLLFARWPVLDQTGKVVGVAATSRNLDAHFRRSRAYERVSRVLQQLQREYSEPLRIDELAQSAGLSQSQLERDFAHLFGVTPLAYLAQVRMEAALSMLAREESVAAIAQACGYGDQSAFTRRFHRAIGMTPTQYRARLKEER